MQTWPALRYLAATAILATVSASTSSKMTTGAWPPSSSVARLTPSAASLARCLPTTVEPVNEILRMTGEAMRYVETSLGTPKTTLSTPLGRPASSRHLAMASAVAGVSSAGLMMQEQPAASEAAILRAGVTAGKFHGEKAATGPTGSRSTIWRWPALRDGTRRP